MIGMRGRTVWNRAIRPRVARTNTRFLYRAGAYLRTAARRSIRKHKRASVAGKPPRTRRGQLRRSILFGVDRIAGNVVIGPARSVVGRSGAAHEFGGTYRGGEYPKRPFMGPALEKVAPQLPSIWASSIR